MLRIDGAMGEGGGQVLRTALGLSLVTGQPFVLENIRARRRKPGLGRQHLTAVLAAAEIGAARVEGAEIGSPRIAFTPERVRAGSHRFAMPTAGSTTLVLQTVLPALLCADGPSTVELVGGTHNPLAPPFEFLAHAWLPALARLGAQARLELLRHGFYPAGGGVMRAHVAPASWRTTELLARPHDPRVRVHVVWSRLPIHVIKRETGRLATRLSLSGDRVTFAEVESPGPGNAILVFLDLGEVTELVTAYGERGVLAERVADGAAAETEALLAARVPVGPHLADQLLIPMALAGGGAFRTLAPTEHTRTNARVVELFLPAKIALREDTSTGGAPPSWIVEVRRA